MPDVSNIFSDSWLHFVIYYYNLLSWEFTVYSKSQKPQTSLDYQELICFFLTLLVSIGPCDLYQG